MAKSAAYQPSTLPTIPTQRTQPLSKRKPAKKVAPIQKSLMSGGR